MSLDVVLDSIVEEVQEASTGEFDVKYTSLNIQVKASDLSNPLSEGLFQYRSVSELVVNSTPLPKLTSHINIFGVIGQKRQDTNFKTCNKAPEIADGHDDLTALTSSQGVGLSTHFREMGPVFSMKPVDYFARTALQVESRSLISSQLVRIRDLEQSNRQSKLLVSCANAAQNFMPSPPTSVVWAPNFNINPKFGAAEQLLTAPATPDHLKSHLREPEINVPTPKAYRPTNMALEQAGIILPPRPSPRSNKIGNYQGSGNSQRHVFNLPDDENCTLFLKNIPETTHISEIFDEIDTGPVFCLHINPANESFATCAAKLSFMRPESAARFMAKINSQFGIWFHGKQLHGVYNREGDRVNRATLSRVIVIEGPEDIMTRRYWEAYFRKVCVYQLDRVLTAPCHKPGRASISFAFSRIDGQSQSCLQAIQLQDEYQGQVEVHYGLDPCGQDLGMRNNNIPAY